MLHIDHSFSVPSGNAIEQLVSSPLPSYTATYSDAGATATALAAFGMFEDLPAAEYRHTTHVEYNSRSIFVADEPLLTRDELTAAISHAFAR